MGEATDNRPNNQEEQSFTAREFELIQELVRSCMEKNEELQYENFKGYELPPRTQFFMLKKAAVSIKYRQLTFNNMAAIRLFEGVKHVLTVVNTEKKRLAVVPCAEEESASVEWAALGDPSHICLLRNMKEKSLAVVTCDGKDNMSIRVPEGFLELHKSFKIHSKQFVYETLTG